MLEVLISIIVVSLICGLLYGLVTYAPIGDPFKSWAAYAVIVVYVILIIYILIGVLGGGGLGHLRLLR